MQRSFGSGTVDRGAVLATSNPFEKHQNKRLRQSVLGRQVHGGARNVALARSKALEKRSSTLLKEYEASNKANSFVDKRIGAKADASQQDQVLLERMKRERKRQSRKSKFNLEENSNTDKLTHFGKVCGS